MNIFQKKYYVAFRSLLNCHFYDLETKESQFAMKQ